MVALLGDEAGCEALGRAGHARVRASMTWRHVADRMAPGLDALVA
jgi:hypothetical protein